MHNFLVNFNVYGAIKITAKDQEHAIELVQEIKKDEWMKHLSEELSSGSLEIGTIDKL